MIAIVAIQAETTRQKYWKFYLWLDHVGKQRPFLPRPEVDYILLIRI